MPIQTKCDQCAKTYRVNESMVGKSVRCKECGHTFQVRDPNAPQDGLDLTSLEQAVAPQASAGPRGAADASLDPLAPPVGHHHKSGGLGGLPNLSSSTSFLKRYKLAVVALVVLGLGALLFPTALRLVDRVTGRRQGATYARLFGGDLMVVLDGHFGDSRDVATSVMRPSLSMQEGVLQGRAKIIHGEKGYTDLLIMLPPGTHADGTLSCVFVAPAGSDLLSGMDLSAADSEEFLPYARNGIAVVAYSISGKRQGKTDQAIGDSLVQFAASDGGLANFRDAMEFALARFPEINKQELYAAGHSSAGTLALQIASVEKRLKGVCAYAPNCAMGARFTASARSDLERIVPGAGKFIDAKAPENIRNLNCPVRIYMADNDSVVDPAAARAFESKFPGKVAVVRSPDGDHRDRLVAAWIPQAIGWINKSEVAVPLPSSEDIEKIRKDREEAVRRAAQASTAKPIDPFETTNANTSNNTNNKPDEVVTVDPALANLSERERQQKEREAVIARLTGKTPPANPTDANTQVSTNPPAVTTESAIVKKIAPVEIPRGAKVIMPTNGAFAAVVTQDSGNDVVRSVSLEDGATLGVVRVPSTSHDAAVPSIRGKSEHCISPDGQTHGKVVTFPRWGVMLSNVTNGQVIKTVDINENFGSAALMQITADNRLVVAREKGADRGLEVLDAKRGTSLKQVALPPYTPTPANGVLSPDGKNFAMIVDRAPAERAENLVIFDLTGARYNQKKTQIKEMASPNRIEPVGMAFSPDSKKLAALFQEGRSGVIVVWRVYDSKVLTMVNCPSGSLPLRSATPNGRPPIVSNDLAFLGNEQGFVLCNNTVLSADGSKYWPIVALGDARSVYVTSGMDLVGLFGLGNDFSMSRVSLDQTMLATKEPAK